MGWFGLSLREAPLLRAARDRMSRQVVRRFLTAVMIGLAAQAAGGAALAATLEETMRTGLLALKAGDQQTALEKMEAAVELAPEDVRPWMGLAQARRVSGDTVGAEDAIGRALEVTPQTGEFAHAFAMYFAEGGEFDKAGDFEARYARMEPEAKQVFLRTASWYLAGGRPRDAAEFARSGLERGESAELYDVLGKALAGSGDTAGAEEAMRTAIRMRPFDEDLRYNLGYLFLRAGEFETAAAAFMEGRKVFDKSPRLELGIGVARFAERRFGEAVEQFLRVSRLAPGLEQPHYFLSRALEHAQDRMAEVRARFDAFDEARPGHYLAPFLQAKGLLASIGPAGDKGDLAAAEALLRRSIERKTDYWESHFELGVVEDRLRRFEQAKASLLRAIELSPSSPTPHYRLARVYSRLGEGELARAETAKHQELVSERRSAFSGTEMSGAEIEGGMVNISSEGSP